MNKKSIVLIILIIIVAVVVNILVFNMTKPKKNEVSDTIPEGYISVFHGGSEEQIYETYIYKLHNNKPNYGYNYINVNKTTKQDGSSEYDIEITGRGTLEWSDEVFDIASKNNAYSYVTLPDSDDKYSIEEYIKMFLTN